MARPRKARLVFVAAVAAIATAAVGALIASADNSGDRSDPSFSSDYWKQEYGR